eukprot:UN28438
MPKKIGRSSIPLLVENWIVILEIIHNSRDAKYREPLPPRDAFVTFLPNFPTLPPVIDSKIQILTGPYNNINS